MTKIYDFTQYKTKKYPAEIDFTEMSHNVLVMAREMKNDYMELAQNYNELANCYVEAGELVKGLKDNKELLEVQQEGLTELIYEFIQENNLSSKFYSFLEGKLSEERYYCDIDFLMLDYTDEENK